METPHGTPAITESTQVKGTLGRTIALAVGLVVVTATASIAYATLRARFEAHLEDKAVHLDPMYQVTHGRPVGTFDYGTTITRLDAIDSKLKKLDEKPATTICTPRGGKFICEPKEE